jgi:PPOX class probable F420-dependent enzyme
MPGRLTKGQRDTFLAGRHIAVLVTNGADGHPVPTPIWYLYRDGAFHFRTEYGAIKTQNILQDSKVSICVQDERAPYKAVIAYGNAEIGNKLDWLSEMPRHYLGFIGGLGYERTAQHEIESGPEISISVRPDRYVTFDFGDQTPFYGRLWLHLKRVLPPWL